MKRVVPALVVAGLLGGVPVLLGGCGSAGRPGPAPQLPSALLREARPIGQGERFHPPATGPLIGSCGNRLGPRSGVHVELFAANRVVLVAAGIGTLPPRTFSEGRISRARCYGELVTIDPTGLVLSRPGAPLSLADLFRSWGQPLSDHRIAGFAAPRSSRVLVFVDGHPWPGPPATVPLRRHSVIVLEVGPYVPPHSSYEFPPGS